MSWLLRIHNADVFLNGKQVLNSIDWTMRKKENWAIDSFNLNGNIDLVYGFIYNFII